MDAAWLAVPHTWEQKRGARRHSTGMNPSPVEISPGIFKRNGRLQEKFTAGNGFFRKIKFTGGWERIYPLLWRAWYWGVLSGNQNPVLSCLHIEHALLLFLWGKIKEYPISKSRSACESRSPCLFVFYFADTRRYAEESLVLGNLSFLVCFVASGNRCHKQPV